MFGSFFLYHDLQAAERTPSSGNAGGLNKLDHVSGKARFRGSDRADRFQEITEFWTRKSLIAIFRGDIL